MANTELWSGLTSAFNIYEIDVVGTSVNHCPESHRICNLSVKPDVFIGGEQPSELGADNTDNVAQHGYEDKTTIEGKNKTSATGCPDGKLQTVESSQLDVRCLWEDELVEERMELIH
jgi:hypothetical protein